MKKQCPDLSFSRAILQIIIFSATIFNGVILILSIILFLGIPLSSPYIDNTLSDFGLPLILIFTIVTPFLLLVNYLLSLLPKTQKVGQTARNIQSLFLFYYPLYFAVPLYIGTVIVGILMSSLLPQLFNNEYMVKMGSATMLSFVIFGTILNNLQKNERLQKLITAISGAILISSVLFFVIGAILDEMIPEMWTGQFKLNDSKGLYILTFDGDYWVNYYTLKHGKTCTYTNKQDVYRHCFVDFERRESVNIHTSRVDVQPFIEKAVALRGHHVRVWPNGSYTYCYQKNKWTLKKCLNTRTPGMRVFSPLFIDNMQMDEGTL